MRSSSSHCAALPPGAQVGKSSAEGDEVLARWRQREQEMDEKSSAEAQAMERSGVGCSS